QGLFEKKGFEQTTVDEIAAVAELGKGTIYSYFKSKEEIYIAILEKRLDFLEKKMREAVANPESATDALYSLYDAFIEYHRERKGFIDTLFVQVDEQILYRLGGVVGGLKSKASVWMEIVGSMIQWGIERGEFCPIDVEKISKTIVGMILGLIVQFEMGQINEDLAGYRDAVFRLIFDGIKEEVQ
ncbi:MAG: TetR/AcrR family transcriptional regulator, partial [Bacteroidota bacterium]